MFQAYLAPALTAAIVSATPLIPSTMTADGTDGDKSVVATPSEKDAPVTSCRSGLPLIIGHRGASGYRPEHTLASYELAARMGADFIEPDLVATKDHVLVARHENEISGTTDVAERPEFTDRKATKIIDGDRITGWFTEDFTLAELKTLRAKERLPELRQRNTIYDGMYSVPTFDEILKLRARLSRELRRPIGIYPETKHPTYFQQLGLDLEQPLVQSLQRFGLNHPAAPVFVQSFELTNLKELNGDGGLRAKSVFLIWKSGAPYDLAAAGDDRDYAHFTTTEGLKTLADQHIDGIGPEMSLVIGWKDDGTLGEDTGLVSRAHQHRLAVHPYTFRNENAFLPKDYTNGSPDAAAYGKATQLMMKYLDTGIDGMFTDNPDTGVAARDLWAKPPRKRPGCPPKR